MSSLPDTEITLGTGKLLVLFFGLVGLSALFFGLGYSLGRRAEPALAATSAGIVPQTAPGTSKASSGATAASPMTFYKSVEQKDANPQLTPASDAKTDTAGPTTNASPGQAIPQSAPDPTTTLPTSAYFVQVAAVSKQEDAEALVEALKKKDYPAFVAAASTGDKLVHVQVGPFTDIKDAEIMRGRLVGDGYSPILKK